MDLEERTTSEPEVDSTGEPSETENSPTTKKQRNRRSRLSVMKICNLVRPVKCANRECNNPYGQLDKPRSIYCSTRCQYREQNLRQGRIKDISKKIKPKRKRTTSSHFKLDQSFHEGSDETEESAVAAYKAMLTAATAAAKAAPSVSAPSYPTSTNPTTTTSSSSSPSSVHSPSFTLSRLHPNRIPLNQRDNEAPNIILSPIIPVESRAFPFTNPFLYSQNTTPLPALPQRSVCF